MIDIKTKSVFTVSFAVILTYSTSAFAVNSSITTALVNDFKITHTHLPVELKSIPSNSYKTAAICALGFDDGCGYDLKPDKDKNLDLNSKYVKKCISMGYTQAGPCEEPMSNGIKCKYNSYFTKPCFCDGYGYDAANCKAPKVLGGGVCGTQWATCTCPPSISIGANQICIKKCDSLCLETSNCKSGTVPNAAKDRCLTDTPPDGSSPIPCTQYQIQTDFGITESGKNYYFCRNKTCADYPGYRAINPEDFICTAEQKGSMICFKDCKNDVCPSGTSKTNNCSYGHTTTTTAAGSTCYSCSNCTPKDCSDFSLSIKPDTSTNYETCSAGCGDTSIKYKITGCKIPSDYFLDNPYSVSGICYGTLRTWIDAGSLIK